MSKTADMNKTDHVLFIALPLSKITGNLGQNQIEGGYEILKEFEKHVVPAPRFGGWCTPSY